MAHEPTATSLDRSNPFGKDHVPNLSEHLTRSSVGEGSIVDKPFRKTGGPSPASHRPRLVPVRHVDMKAPVADLKKYDVTVVGKRTVCGESSDRGLQCLNVCRPCIGEKFMRGRNHFRTPDAQSASVTRAHRAARIRGVACLGAQRSLCVPLRCSSSHRALTLPRSFARRGRCRYAHIVKAIAGIDSQRS